MSIKSKALLVILLFCSCAAYADMDNRLYLPGRERIEGSYTYSQLLPNDSYGSYNDILLDYYSKISNTYTQYYELGGFNRKDGNAMYFCAGAYKDWSKSFYTYTALSLGTNSGYVPQYRVDNDFNFKITQKRNFVLTLGGTYIQAHDEHSNLMWSAGVTAYFQKLILSYRYFINRSDPGDVMSPANLFSISYGQEGKSWTYLNYYSGTQGYLATYVTPLQTVEQDVYYIELKHRKWLKMNYGVFGGLNYLKLNDGYEKHSFTLGLFREF